MAFHNSYLTNAGADILNAAAGGEKLIWTRVLASSYDTDNLTTQEMKALTGIAPSGDSQYVGSGAVTSHISNNGTLTASISCQIKNTVYTQGGPAMTIGIWALTDNPDRQETLVIVARHGADPGSSPSSSDITYISSASLDSQYTLSVSCGIRIDDFADPGNVQLDLSVIDDYYATSAELLSEVTARQALEDRAVSAYAPGNTSAGVAQNIRGTKTFINTTYHSNNVLPTKSTLLLGSSVPSNRWDTVYAKKFDGTSFNGNSATATSLETARAIDGVEFSGSDNIYHYAVCDTDANVAKKEITLPGFSSTLGAVVIIRFKNTNTASNPTLSINGGTEHSLYLYRVDDGSTSSNYSRVGTSEASSWGPGETVMFVLDTTNSGTTTTNYWYMLSKPRLTRYSYVSTTSSNSSYPLVFAASTATSYIKTLYTDSVSSLYYNPDTNTLTSPNFNGVLSGSASSLMSTVTTPTSDVTGTIELTNPFTTVVFWTADRGIVPDSDYGRNLGYYSTAPMTSPRRWNYIYARYLGSSDSHITSAYINNLYVSGTGVVLSDYIKLTTVNNATNAVTATNLADIPVLTWSNATSSSTGSTLKVSAGNKESANVTIDTVRKAYNSYISATSTNNAYPIVLCTPVSASGSVISGFKTLYSDSVNSFYYNTSTNELSVPRINCDTLTMSDASIVQLAIAMGINLAKIDVYLAGGSGGTTISLSPGATVTFGRGASGNYSNYTICSYGSQTSYLYGTYKVTRLISQGVCSSTSNNVTLGGYSNCANPSYGTPCTCLAILQ